MSKAKLSFDNSINDAQALLEHFDALPQPHGDSAEVLKRAGLVMAVTAWETYVEDRLREEVSERLRVLSGSYAGNFVESRLANELKRLHNPTSEKTKKLFVEYLEVDITLHWEWQNYDQTKARKTLDDLITKRGDAVHRSRQTAATSQPTPHLVKRDELERSIKFLKSLVAVTDNALST